jgi:iron complex outermembrane receptor protein
MPHLPGWQFRYEPAMHNTTRERFRSLQNGCAPRPRELWIGGNRGARVSLVVSLATAALAFAPIALAQAEPPSVGDSSLPTPDATDEPSADETAVTASPPAEQKAERTVGQPDEVEEIVVTATRVPRSIREIPAAVSSVTDEDLKNMRMLGFKEALTGLPGVQAETRNGGYDARLIIRGAGLKARYGIREIMVLLDGVPITDPDGLSRLDFVDTQLIERIDVIRGPNSTLYGANAVGGVVNIITTDPFDEIQSVKFGFGDFDTQLYNLILGTHFGETYVTVTGTRKSSASWRRWNRFESDQWGVKVGRRLEDLGFVELNAYYTQADLRLPGTLTAEEFEADPPQRTSGTFQHSGRYSDILMTYLRSKLDLDIIELEPRIYLQRWNHLHPVTGFINDGGALVAGIDLQGNVKHDFWGMSGILTMGVVGLYEDSHGKKFTYRDVQTGAAWGAASGTERIVATLSDAKGELAETSSSMVGKWGVYAQESLRPVPRLILDAGIRYDQVFFDLRNRTQQEFVWRSQMYAPVEIESHVKPSAFEAVSPRLGVVFAAHEVVSLFANLATGFQTPQSSELEDNIGLVPSRTVSVEGGVKARLGRHSVEATVYHMQIEEEIVQARLPDETVSYSNAGRTKKTGVELAASVQPILGLQLGATYAYSDFSFARFDEPIRAFDPASHRMVTEVYDRSGNRLPYVPRHQYSLFASFEHATGLRAVVRTHTWGEYFVDSANSETHPGYEFLTSALIGWEGDHWSLTFDVKNLFDQRYAVEVTKAGDTLRFYPGEPRSFFGTVAFRL